MPLKKLVLLLLMLPLASRAAIEILDAKSKEAVSSETYKASEGWHRSDSGLSTYGVAIEFSDTDFLKNVKMSGGAEIITTEEKLVLLLGSNNVVLKDAAGDEKATIRWTPDRTGIIYNRCRTKIFSFRLNKKDESIDFPLAIACELDKSPPRFTISVPEEIEWIDYSVTEVSGKGNRTRVFELPSGNLRSDIVGQFEFKNGDKNFVLPIAIKRLGEDKAKSKGLEFEKSLYIGSSSINYEAATEAFAAQSFLLKFKGLSGYFLNALRFNMQLKNTFNLSEDPKAINLTDIGLGVGYFKNWGGFDAGVVGQYRYLDYLHVSSGGRMQSSQLGVLLASSYRFGSNRVSGEVSMANFGSKVVQSHMNIAIGYAYLMTIRGFPTWLGAEYEMQTVTATDEAGNSRKFDDTSMLISFSF